MAGAGVDSGIKVDPATVTDIAALEKKKKAFIIMQIGKPEGGKVEKVLTKLAMDNDEVAAAIAAGEVTVNGETVKLGTKLKNETDIWFVFRSAIVTFPMAYGSCFVDYKTKDGRDSDKLVFIVWNPDGATIKDKMKYSSTRVVNKFGSTPVNHQASDADEVSYAEIEAVVNKK